MNPSEREPITADQVLQKLTGSVIEVEQALLQRAKKRRYPEDEVNETLEYLKSKSELLAEGLLPADDHSFLDSQIDTWFGMALTSAQYANELETSDRVIRRAVDAIHVEMVVNNMISEEVQAEILKRWPAQDSTASKLS